MAQALVDASVHELQGLHAEFHVTQPAGAQLDLALGVLGGDEAHHAAAHGLHIAHEVLPSTDLPHQRRGDVQEAPGELGVAGHRTRLQHGLELPVLRPALVIGPVALQAAHQRPGVALRTQRGIDLPDGAGGRMCRADPRRGPGDPVRDRDGLGLAHLVGCRFPDEQHVDVGQVVQLLGAALAQGDDPEPGPFGVRGLCAGDGQGTDHDGVGKVRQLGGDLVDDRGGLGGGQVASGDAQQVPLVGQAQPIGGTRIIGHRHGELSEAVICPLGQSDLGQQVGSDLFGAPPCGLRLQGRQVSGVGDEVLAQGLAPTQHGDQPTAPGFLGEGLQGAHQVGCLQVDQAGQGLIGVGGCGQRIHQFIGAFGQSIEQLGGAAGVDESLAGQLAGRRPRASVHVPT
ncbi:hypothetical protein MAJHIDBO_01324 [Propionibacterium freudenreichii subsp. shermanii]|nr:hypothetical protein MAJHIDBO_01324 [Propionibacterium freudenreichii subsp. shermanii]SPS09119.1 hypothetical protein MAJHIDBO_01324 [Propionibacterium freudenreichii subsp. shermanii]